jgi:hypothetical protein
VPITQSGLKHVVSHSFAASRALQSLFSAMSGAPPRPQVPRAATVRKPGSTFSRNLSAGARARQVTETALEAKRDLRRETV